MIRLKVNRKARDVDVDPDTPLLMQPHPELRSASVQFREVIVSASTRATNFRSTGDELSFFQIRLNGSRTFISTTGSKTIPRGQCQRTVSGCQEIPIRH